MWKKCANKGKILMKWPEVVNWWWKYYLNNIKKVCNQNKTIVFIDQTWTDNNLTFKNC